MKKFPVLTAFAVATLSLTACGGVQASSTDTAPAGSNQGSSAPAAPATEAASPAVEGGDETTGDVESAAPEDLVASFGKAFTWDDGLAVTIGKPKPYRPSQWAAGTENYKNFVSFEVRVVNGTNRAWDPSLFSTTLQSNNEEGEEVFDVEKLRGAPTTKLLKGREAKFTVAYGVANPKDLVMEVNPDYEHESVLFQQ